MPFEGIHDLARRRALASGAEAWLDSLPALVESLEREWSIVVGRPFTTGSEGFVAEATAQSDGTRSVLKLVVADAAARNEITALQLANGDGCARLLRADPARGALLLERLGAPLSELALPLARRHEILCATVARVWRPAAGYGLTTGAEKGAWLVDFITRLWEELGRPCSERAVDHARACARRRIAAHDDERAVLVHGDVHEWNTLQVPGTNESFKLVDPDGLLAEAEYDLGILIREDPAEALAADARVHARALAAQAGVDETAIWEWAAAERVSTGLLCTQLGLQPSGLQMLAVADRIALDA